MNEIRKPTPADLSLLGVLVIIWGSAFIFIKIAVHEVSPFWLVLIRSCLGFLVLLPWVLYKGLILPRDFSNWWKIIVIAFLSLIIPFYLIAHAEQYINAGIAALLMGFSPIMALVISHFSTNDDTFSLNKFIGVAFGFCGLVLIVGVEALYGLGTEQVMYQLLVLFASCCYVTSSALVRKVKGIPPVRMTAIILFISSIVLIPLSFFTPEPFPKDISLKAIGSMAFLGIFSTGIAYILRYHLVRTIGLSFFALGLNLIPVVGLLLGYIMLGETLSWQAGVAVCLMITGLMIARKRNT